MHPSTITGALAAAAALCAVAAPSALADVPAPPAAVAAPATGAEKAQPQSAQAPAARVVPGRYIVKVQRGHDPKVKAKEHGAKTKFTFTDAFNGFSADLTAKQLHRLEGDPDVAGIRPVTEVHGDLTQTSNLPWGLDRIDQRSLPFTGSFTSTSNGAGVNAYIIDSGIQTSHPEFGGRATAVWDGVFDGWNGQDCFGHGTHVAGTVGGATTGVAKAVRLYSVRTLDCRNGTTSDREIAAVDWVRRNFHAPAVANISIGGPKDAYINQAVTNLVNAGVFVAVSAGNANVDACTQSPASAAGTFTVAASDNNDNKASFSDWGACVDGYAPGVLVRSSIPGSTYGLMDGTSMAAPHVTGAIADAKAYYGDSYTSATWVQWLKDNATLGAIGGNIAGTPNRLLFKGTL